MRKAEILKFLIMVLLMIPAIFLFPVELILIVTKNLIEVVMIYAEDEDPDEALKKIYLLVFAVAAVKISGDLFYLYFGLDLETLIEEGLLQKEDLARPSTELRAFVVEVRRAYFKEKGGIQEILFENFVRFMTWDDDQLIHHMVEEYEKKKR
jgi:hypothetical protein